MASAATSEWPLIRQLPTSSVIPFARSMAQSIRGDKVARFRAIRISVLCGDLFKFFDRPLSPVLFTSEGNPRTNLEPAWLRQLHVEISIARPSAWRASSPLRAFHLTKTTTSKRTNNTPPKPYKIVLPLPSREVPQPVQQTHCRVAKSVVLKFSCSLLFIFGHVFPLASPHTELRSFGCMINENVTLMARTKCCQARVLTRFRRQRLSFGLRRPWR